jgi:hypothetical protein
MNDLSYTLHFSSHVPQKNKKGHWNKGCTAWNKGKKWDDIYDAEMQEKLRKHLKEIAKLGAAGRGHPHPKPVIQMDEYGDRLHWYESSEAAARKLGIIGRNIRQVCDGKRHHAGNFRWKWDEKFM